MQQYNILLRPLFWAVNYHLHIWDISRAGVPWLVSLGNTGRDPTSRSSRYDFVLLPVIPDTTLPRMWGHFIWRILKLFWRFLAPLLGWGWPRNQARSPWSWVSLSGAPLHTFGSCFWVLPSEARGRTRVGFANVSPSPDSPGVSLGTVSVSRAICFEQCCRDVSVTSLESCHGQLLLNRPQ